MITNQQSIFPVLLKLGQRLKEARLDRNESQEVFAQRLGLARQTYSKMEKGSPQIPIGAWLEASLILNRLQSWEGVLAPQENLFEEFEKKRAKASGRRQRQAL